MTTVLGLDYGGARIGVAVGYEAEKMVLPVTVIKNGPGMFEELAELVEEHEATVLIIGLPLELSGKEGEMAKKVRAFGDECEQKIGCRITFMDERLTSKQVSKQLTMSGISQKKQRGKLDDHAATLILAQYFACQ